MIAGSGYSTLQPILSPAQDIAARLVDIDQRLLDLERAIPALSVSASDPTGSPLPGTMHLNSAQGRFWMYTGSLWVTADMAHAYVEDTGTKTAPSGAGIQWIGPTANIWIPDSSMVGVYAEVSCMNRQGGTAEAWLGDGHGNSWRWAWNNSAAGCVYATTVSGAIGTGGGVGSDTGGVWPSGGWWIFSAAATGAQAFNLGFNGIGASATFQGARLYVVTF